MEAHVGVAGYRKRFDPISALNQLRSELGSGRAIERRGGLIPINGILRRIGNDRAGTIFEARVSLTLIRTEKTQEGVLFYRTHHHLIAIGAKP